MIKKVSGLTKLICAMSCLLVIITIIHYRSIWPTYLYFRGVFQPWRHIFIVTVMIVIAIAILSVAVAVIVSRLEKRIEKENNSLRREIAELRLRLECMEMDY